MAQITLTTAQLGVVADLGRRIVRFVRRLAFAALAGIAAIAALLADGGFSAADTVITLLLVAAPAILLFFAQGLHEVLALPDRLRNLPGDGQERIAELTRIAGDARTTRKLGTPRLLWRLRRSFGSVRDLAGFALPLRVFTPGFLALSGIAAVLCASLAAAGLVAVLMLLGA